MNAGWIDGEMDGRFTYAFQNTFQPSRPTNMSESEMMLTNSLESEEPLHQRLRYLSEVIQRQLQETERRHKEQLETRIYHNTLLSQDLNKLSPQTK